MNILFLTQVLPYPLDAGPKIRAYYVLRHLTQKHNVTLVSFTRPGDTPAAIAHLAEFCAAVHCVPISRSKLRDGIHLAKSLFTKRSFIIERDRVPLMWQLLAHLLEQKPTFDAVHADQLWMAPYALWAGARITAQSKGRPKRPLLVLDQHNAVFMIPQRMAQATRNPAARLFLSLEARKLAAYEAQICTQFSRVTWVTGEDYNAVSSQAQSVAVARGPLSVQRKSLRLADHGRGRAVNSAVIPICVDPEEAPEVTVDRLRPRITFVGGLHYPPNAQGARWFAQEVFPQVLRACPHAILTIIGKNPSPKLRQMDIPSHNLEITGYVDDPAPYLAESAVSIVPIHAGGGMRVKILDAWARRIPVVSTTVGAEGIRICPNRDILIADTAAGFAQAVVALLQRPSLAHRIAQAAHETLVRHYDWRTQYQTWDSVYRI